MGSLNSFTVRYRDIFIYFCISTLNKKVTIMNFENVHAEQGAVHVDYNIGDPQARLIAEIVSYQACYSVDYDDISVIRVTLTPSEISGRVRVIFTGDIFEFKLSLG